MWKKIVVVLLIVPVFLLGSFAFAEPVGDNPTMPPVPDFGGFPDEPVFPSGEPLPSGVPAHAPHAPSRTRIGFRQYRATFVSAGSYMYYSPVSGTSRVEPEYTYVAYSDGVAVGAALEIDTTALRALVSGDYYQLDATMSYDTAPGEGSVVTYSIGIPGFVQLSSASEAILSVDVSATMYLTYSDGVTVSKSYPVDMSALSSGISFSSTEIGKKKVTSSRLVLRFSPSADNNNVAANSDTVYFMSSDKPILSATVDAGNNVPSLLSGMGSLLQKLFVPDGQEIADFFGEMSVSSSGALADAAGVLSDAFDKLTAGGGSTKLKFPAFYLPVGGSRYKVWDAYEFKVDGTEPAAKAFGYVRTVTSALISIAVIYNLYKTFRELFGRRFS